jgi:hypothetical protein
VPIAGTDPANIFTVLTAPSSNNHPARANKFAGSMDQPADVCQGCTGTIRNAVIDSLVDVGLILIFPIVLYLHVNSVDPGMSLAVSGRALFLLALLGLASGVWFTFLVLDEFSHTATPTWITRGVLIPAWWVAFLVVLRPIVTSVNTWLVTSTYFGMAGLAANG